MKNDDIFTEYVLLYDDGRVIFVMKDLPLY
jgi:hypothetical protein